MTRESCANLKLPADFRALPIDGLCTTPRSLAGFLDCKLVPTGFGTRDPVPGAVRFARENAGAIKAPGIPRLKDGRACATP